MEANKEKQIAAQKRYKDRHRERINSRLKARRADRANKPKYLAGVKACYDRNKSKIAERKKQKRRQSCARNHTASLESHRQHLKRPPLDLMEADRDRDLRIRINQDSRSS